MTYVLPGLPGLAIATAVVLERWIESDAAADLINAAEMARGRDWRLGAWRRQSRPPCLPGGRFGLAPVAVLGAAALTVLLIAALGWLAQAIARRQDDARR